MDSENHFDIDPIEGTLSVNDALDRERNAELNVTVVATKVSKYDGISFTYGYGVTCLDIQRIQVLHAC